MTTNCIKEGFHNGLQIVTRTRQRSKTNEGYSQQGINYLEERGIDQGEKGGKTSVVHFIFMKGRSEHGQVIDGLGYHGGLQKQIDHTQ